MDISIIETLASRGTAWPATAALLAVGSAGGESLRARIATAWGRRTPATRRRVRALAIFGALGTVLFALPGRAVDPYGVVVPREVVLFATLILLIEWCAYVLVGRLGGSRGLAVTGLLAGAANSLAAAGVLARLARRSRRASDPASFALLLATFAMIVRNVAIAVVVADDLAGALWQPALVMGSVTLAGAALLWRGSRHEDGLGLELDSPLSLSAAAKFGLAYVAILLVSVGAESTLGSTGLFAAAFAGGLVSSGAVAVSAATVFESGAVAPEVAVGMIVLGIAGSLCAKIALVEWVTDDLRRRATLPLATVAVAGVGAAGLLWLVG